MPSGFRHVLLFLLYPDEFEAIVSSGAKTSIVERILEKEVPEDAVSVDKALFKIRRLLERESGDQEVHFFKPPFTEFWRDDDAKAWFQQEFGEMGTWQMNMNVVGEEMWPGVANDGLASIGWDDMRDLRRSREDIEKDLVSQGWGKNPYMRSRFLYEFANKMEVDDIVVATVKGKALVGWGRVTGKYRYDADGEDLRKHTRTIDWHICDEEIRLLGGLASSKRLTDYGGYKCWMRLALWRMRDRAKPQPPPKPPYSPEIACQHLFINRDHFDRLVRSLQSQKNLILQGPPAPERPSSPAELHGASTTARTTTPSQWSSSISPTPTKTSSKAIVPPMTAASTSRTASSTASANVLGPTRTPHTSSSSTRSTAATSH